MLTFTDLSIAVYHILCPVIRKKIKRIVCQVWEGAHQASEASVSVGKGEKKDKKHCEQRIVLGSHNLCRLDWFSFAAPRICLHVRTISLSLSMLSLKVSGLSRKRLPLPFIQLPPSKRPRRPVVEAGDFGGGTPLHTLIDHQRGDC
jgi:hypothetical protein